MQLLKTDKKDHERPTSGSLTRFRDEMNRMVDHFMHDPWTFPWMTRNGSDWIPSLDIMEGEREVTVRVEIPGVSSKDVDVSISGRVLTISGEKEESQKEEGKGYFVTERNFGSFRRCIMLPEGVDPGRVTAQQDNGILTIKIARLKEATPQHIPIKGGPNG